MRHTFLGVRVLRILKYATFNQIAILNNKVTVKDGNTKWTPCICCNVKIQEHAVFLSPTDQLNQFKNYGNDVTKMFPVKREKLCSRTLHFFDKAVCLCV